MATSYPSGLDSYTTWVDNTDTVVASIANNMQDAIEAIQAKVGIDSSAVTTSLDYKVNNFFISGRKLYLYENTAPTGWSIVAVTDKVLAVKGGSNAYNVTGGNTAGSFDISHTHSVVIPVSGWGTIGSAQGYGTLGGNLGYGTALYGPTSNRTLTSASGGSSTYRPAAAVGIIVTKT